MLSRVLEPGPTSTSMSNSPIAKAIRAAYEEQGLSQVEVARRMGVDQTRVSRLALGKWKPNHGPEPELLARIEKACERPLGWILRRAGYVDDVRTIREAIAMDPELTPGARQALLAFYEGVLKTVEGVSSADEEA